jgi:hypothetical protein
LADNKEIEVSEKAKARKKNSFSVLSNTNVTTAWSNYRTTEFVRAGHG